MDPPHKFWWGRNCAIINFPATYSPTACRGDSLTTGWSLDRVVWLRILGTWHVFYCNSYDPDVDYQLFYQQLSSSSIPHTGYSSPSARSFDAFALSSTARHKVTRCLRFHSPALIVYTTLQVSTIIRKPSSPCPAVLVSHLLTGISQDIHQNDPCYPSPSCVDAIWLASYVLQVPFLERC